MRLIVRTLILFALVLWIGGVVSFPLIASEVFRSGADPHVADTIIARSLHDLHFEGIWTGIAFLVLLFAAYKFKALPRSVLPAAIVTVILLALTVFSLYGIHASKTVEIAIAVGGITLMALLAWNFPDEERRA